MAWLNEEERALGKGKFAPYSDFRMGVREANAVPRDFQKVKSTTGEFDRTLDSANRFYATYEKVQEDKNKSLKDEKDNTIINAYALSLNDLRNQLSTGQIQPTEFSRRERQLTNSYLQTGVAFSDLKSVRDSLGGKDIQTAEAAGYTQAAKNAQLIEKERAEDIAKEVPWLSTASYAKRLAYANYSDSLTRLSQEYAEIMNAPESEISKEDKELYRTVSEQTRQGKVIFATTNALKSFQTVNPDRAITPGVYSQLEQQAVLDLMNQGWNEQEARMSTRIALQGVKEIADTNWGSITNNSEFMKKQVNAVENAQKMMAYQHMPIASVLAGLGRTGEYIASQIPNELKGEANNLAELLKNSGKATQNVTSIINGTEAPKVFTDDPDAKEGAVNLARLSLLNGVVTFAPDAAASTYSVGVKNFNSENFKQDDHGVVGMTDDELKTSIENTNNYKAYWLSGSTKLMEKARKDLWEACENEKMCFEMGEKITKEFVRPGSELQQAAKFLQNSVIDGNIRLKEDGTLAITESSGFLQGVGTTVYKNQYLRNLDTINRMLLQEPNIKARKFLAQGLYGRDLQDLGAATTLDEGLIKDITSRLFESGGKLFAKTVNAADEVFNPSVENLKERVADGEHLNRVDTERLKKTLEDEVGSEVARGTAEQAANDIYSRLMAKLRRKPISSKTIEASFSKTYDMSFPSVQMTDENTEVINDIREAFINMKQNERDLGYLYERQDSFTDPTTGKQIKEDWQYEIDRLIEENKEYDKIIRDGLKQITTEKKKSSSNTKISPEHSTMVDKYSDEFGVDSDIVKRMLFKESSGDRKAVSPAGAKGLMQIMPRTFEDIKRELNLPKDADIFDPETNVRAGCYYFAKMMEKFGQDVNKALAAYNWGPGNVLEAVREYGEDWFEGARDLGITVKDPKTGKNTKRYLPKETQKYVLDLGDMYA